MTLFDLFSEFTGLVMIARQTHLKSLPNSIQSKFAKTAEAKDTIGDILPYSGSLKKYSKEKQIQNKQFSQLTGENLQDFRVPLQTFRESCLLLAKTKHHLRNFVLRAIGVDVRNKDERVSWE
jgi:hypothetical protein